MKYDSYFINNCEQNTRRKVILIDRSAFLRKFYPPHTIFTLYFPIPRIQLNIELLRLCSENETESWNYSSYIILSFVLLFQWKTAFQNQVLINLIQSILLKCFKSLSCLDTVRNRQCAHTNWIRLESQNFHT